MKKIFSVAFALLYLSTSNINAGYLQLEEERDIRRVANNVINFYHSHYEDLIALEKENFSKQSPNLENIKVNPSELVTDFIKHKKTFSAEFSQAKTYVKNNKELIKEKIGEDDYQKFMSGLFYIHHLLKTVS